MENLESTTESWQVEAGGQVSETSFDEMRVWIAEGSLLRIDRVRKGNLRWIEAGKVPNLLEFFNAKDALEPTAPVITTSTSREVLGVSEQPASAGGPHVGASPTYGQRSQQTGEQYCSVHDDAPAALLCDTCANYFCKACPCSYGGTVKICPFCGAMCSSIAKVEQAREWSQAASGGFGFRDFGKALAHPFKFKVSLFFGALMFALFSLGWQSAAAFGGIILMASAWFCFMFANTLTFGILGNVANNFSQGRLDENFMEPFDDFSIWDDMVHPFFLTIGVYVSSFGPLITILWVAFIMVVGTIDNNMNAAQTQAARSVSREIPLAAGAAKQSEHLRELLQKDANQQQRRSDAIESGELPGETLMNDAANPNEDTEVLVAEANGLIDQQRKTQLEAAFGASPETKAKEQAAMFQQILDNGMVFLVLGGLALLWGLFYFPAACVVAGYTRTFAETVNPLVGLDTIRRLGFDYVKLLAMGFVLVVMFAIISTVLHAIFNPFDLPAVGNIPATFIGSFFTFYFSVAFSCVIGYMLFKATDRLKLYSRYPKPKA